MIIKFPSRSASQRREEFVLQVKTDQTAAGYFPETTDNQFKFYGHGTYDIDWGDGTVQTGVIGPQVHAYPSAGTYVVRARNWTGTRRFICPAIGEKTDAIKIKELRQWGTTQWTSCADMFLQCHNMVGTFGDVPNLSAVGSMASMFRLCPLFNGSPNASMNSWNTSAVTDMSSMFENAIVFNQFLNDWNVSAVTNMSRMFYFAKDYNQPIKDWNVSNVLNMSSMFFGAEDFNQALSAWNVFSATDMSYMFSGTSSFNQPLNWEVQSVTDMEGMFKDADAFNQNIGAWKLNSGVNLKDMLSTSSPSLGMSTENYSRTLIGWANRFTTQGVPTLRALGAENRRFSTVVYGGTPWSDGRTAREKLRGSTASGLAGWTITGDVGEELILYIETNATASGYTPVTGPTGFTFYGEGTYDIDWGDGQTQTGVSGNQTKTYTTAGSYEIRVRNWSVSTGVPRRHAPPNSTTTDAIKIKEIRQWGATQWTSCAGMFQRCRNMTGTYSDVPNLSASSMSMSAMFFACPLFNGSNASGAPGITTWNTSTVTSMNNTFNGATSFNQAINGWNVSAVTSMSNMFNGATSFNQNIGSWHVSNVTNMTSMFAGATAFNQSINTSGASWNVGSVTSMASMFSGATSFNQTLHLWNVGNVTDMSNMFAGATSFHQAIDTWNVTSVTNMTSMFNGATAFNMSLAGWDTSAVTLMTNMFLNASIFNQNIGSWSVSSVTNMGGMFAGASAFNQNIGGWSVGNVTNMANMFLDATSFNQNISGWNVSNVTDMSGMFNGANAFKQNLGPWNLRTSGVDLSNMLNTTSTSLGMTSDNYSRTLLAWGNKRNLNNGPNGVSLGANNRRYNATIYGGTPYDRPTSARENLTLATVSGGGGWSIAGDAQL